MIFEAGGNFVASLSTHRMVVLLLLHLLQVCQFVADFLGVPIHARTEEDLPRQDGLRVAALADAGQAELGVLLHRNEYVAGVQST